MGWRARVIAACAAIGCTALTPVLTGVPAFANPQPSAGAASDVVLVTRYLPIEGGVTGTGGSTGGSGDSATPPGQGSGGDTPGESGGLTYGSGDRTSTNGSMGGLSGTGIPIVALRAYHRAADTLARTTPSCHMDWALLAGIGRVESDHGRHGGAVLNAAGVPSIPIYGPTLSFGDSDNGALDGDPRFDRAVGPMQFIPQTWASYGADGNGDGRADPQNIFDAALGAGRYLCAGGADVRTDAAASVFRYNHSAAYVAMVLGLAQAYRSGLGGSLATPSGSGYATGGSGPGGQPTAYPTKQPTKQPSGKPTKKPTGHPTGKPTGKPTGSAGSSTEPPSGTPTGSSSPTGSHSQSGSGSSSPTGSHSQSGSGSASPTGTHSGSASGSPSGRPTSSSTGSGHPSATPTKQPPETTSPTTDLPSASATKTTKKPTKKPTSKPSPTPSDCPTATKRAGAAPSPTPSDCPTGKKKGGPRGLHADGDLSLTSGAAPSLEGVRDLLGSLTVLGLAAQLADTADARDAKDPKGAAGAGDTPCASPSPTPSGRPTTSPSPTPTETCTPSPCPTGSGRPTEPPAGCPTPTPSPTDTSPTPTPTGSHTPTTSPSPSPTGTGGGNGGGHHHGGDGPGGGHHGDGGTSGGTGGGTGPGGGMTTGGGNGDTSGPTLQPGSFTADTSYGDGTGGSGGTDPYGSDETPVVAPLPGEEAQQQATQKAIVRAHCDRHGCVVLPGMGGTAPTVLVSPSLLPAVGTPASYPDDHATPTGLAPRYANLAQRYDNDTVTTQARSPPNRSPPQRGPP